VKVAWALVNQVTGQNILEWDLKFNSKASRTLKSWERHCDGVESLWALKHWVCFCISFLIMPTSESVNNILTRLLVFLFFLLLTFLLQLGFFLSDTKPKCIANIPSLTTQHVYLEKRPYLSFCWTSMLSRTNTPKCRIGEYFKGTLFHIIKN